MAVLDETVNNTLNYFGHQVCKFFEADVFAYYGGINPQYFSEFRKSIESLAGHDDRPSNLIFFVHTGGGVVEFVEQMVNIIRQHYDEVWFVVPDMAMSAGTILCMSGDKIYMDYTSALGPIDPQVQNNEGQFVPALGYLDQVERMILKSHANQLSDAEFALLQNQDLATLRRYEQAKELSISLLKTWLVKYKFKDWSTHSSTGDDVTPEEKEVRAEQIAEQLSDHKKWHSHGRSINIQTLKGDLNLLIEDYTDNIELRNLVRNYSDLLLDCAKTRNMQYIFHSMQYQSDMEI
jgi:hypothetical protein